MPYVVGCGNVVKMYVRVSSKVSQNSHYLFQSVGWRGIKDWDWGIGACGRTEGGGDSTLQYSKVTQNS